MYLFTHLIKYYAIPSCEINNFHLFALEPLFRPSIIVESHYAVIWHMYTCIYTLYLILLSYQSLYIMYVSPIILVYHNKLLN